MYAPFFQSPPLRSRSAAARTSLSYARRAGAIQFPAGHRAFRSVPGPHIFYQASLPFSEGSTSSKDRMAHSIMLSSGSLVVKFCIHMPAASDLRQGSCPGCDGLPSG